MTMRLIAVLTGVAMTAVPSADGIGIQDGGREAVKFASAKAADAAVQAEAGMPQPRISIDPFHPLDGRNARLLESLIEQLNRTGFSPESRKPHFRWVDEYGGVVSGWSARATEVAPSARGVVITLKVTPEITKTSPTVLNDFILETYLLTEEGPSLLFVQEDSTPKVTVW